MFSFLYFFVLPRVRKVTGFSSEKVSPLCVASFCPAPRNLTLHLRIILHRDTKCFAFHVSSYLCVFAFILCVSVYVCTLSGKSLDSSSLKAQSSTSSQPDSSQGPSAAVYCKSSMARQMQPATHTHTLTHRLCLNKSFLVSSPFSIPACAFKPNFATM